MLFDHLVGERQQIVGEFSERARLGHLQINRHSNLMGLNTSICGGLFFVFVRLNLRPFLYCRLSREAGAWRSLK